MMDQKIRRYLFLALAWLCCVTGFVGIFVPVLPTTPLLLAAAFLFARSSPQAHRWLVSTRAYKRFVLPFKEAGGITPIAKFHILLVSFVVMGISAFLVRNLIVWVVLGCVALWLLYLMLIRIPTVARKKPEAALESGFASGAGTGLEAELELEQKKDS
jgi:uncharacterized membrane protein YbaN (DUF454 family)